MDLKTLEAANFILLALAAAVLGIFGRSHAALKGSQWLARGMGCLAAGALLVALPAAAQGLAAALAISGLAILGVILINVGIAVYLGRRPELWRWEAGLWFLTMGAAAYFSRGPVHPAARSAAVSAALGIELAISVYLLRRPAASAERPARLVSTWPMAVGLGIFSAFNFGRGGAILLAAGSGGGETRVQVGAAIGVMIFIVALTLAGVWMMTAELHAQLERLAQRDELTGIWNRRALRQAAEAELETARRQGRPVALIALDLDHFKRLNDSYGHAGGDAVLRAVAARLKAEGAGEVARNGGEEFALLLAGHDRVGALAMAERLRQALEGLEVVFERRTIRLTASFGVASYLGGGDDWNALSQRADRAMYAAKQAGRNRVMSESAAISGA